MLSVLVDDEETRRDMTRDLALQSCHVAKGGGCVTSDITDLPENSGMSRSSLSCTYLFYVFVYIAIDQSICGESRWAHSYIRRLII